MCITLVGFFFLPWFLGYCIETWALYGVLVGGKHFGGVYESYSMMELRLALVRIRLSLLEWNSNLMPGRVVRDQKCGGPFAGIS